MKRLLALLVLVIAIPVHADVSITFDDGFKSQVQNALPILEQYNIYGTVYVVTSFLGTSNYMTWWDIKHLDAHGWEIADHTISHIDLTKATLEQIEFQLSESKKIFLEHGYDVKNFATPFGNTNSFVQNVIRKYFVSNRAAWALHGVKINDATRLDRYNLTAVALNNNSNIHDIEQTISKADRYNKWLILMVHNVKDDCGSNAEYCVSTQNLKRVVRFCSRNKVHVVTVKQYFDEHGIN